MNSRTGAIGEKGAGGGESHQSGNEHCGGASQKRTRGSETVYVAEPHSERPIRIDSAVAGRATYPARAIDTTDAGAEQPDNRPTVSL